MGYQLWISPQTGIRRKGTTFKELQTLFIDQITTKYIFEPLYSCKINDDVFRVKEKLRVKDFDIVGVIDDNEKVIGYAIREELQEGIVEKYLKEIDFNLIISDSTPISNLFPSFTNKDFVFILHGNEVVGIVTKADINKPIVRIYLFGIISLFEMHLNYWINYYCHDSSWTEKISKSRLEKAKEIYEERKGNNQDLSLLECIQISDKRDILKKTVKFRGDFEYSNNSFDSLLKKIEKIRNELAHSQNSIISNLEWNDFIDTIYQIENFLNESEQKVEEITRTYNKSYKQ